tara:strand:+ start:331 stop:996 length:666 start_codon:yes stop_codon:yes gene_type:complete
MNNLEKLHLVKLAVRFPSNVIPSRRQLGNIPFDNWLEKIRRFGGEAVEETVENVRPTAFDKLRSSNRNVAPPKTLSSPTTTPVPASTPPSGPNMRGGGDHMDAWLQKIKPKEGLAGQVEVGTGTVNKPKLKAPSQPMQDAADERQFDKLIRGQQSGRPTLVPPKPGALSPDDEFQQEIIRRQAQQPVKSGSFYANVLSILKSANAKKNYTFEDFLQPVKPS